MKTSPDALPTELRFVVPGEPVPKGRARHRIVFPKEGKPYVQEYTPDETSSYEKKVELMAKVEVNRRRWITHPNDRFSVVIRVIRTYEGKGGDLDNYLKAILDGMNRSGVFPDDRYVRGFGVVFGPPDRACPRVEVKVVRYPRADERRRSPRRS